MTQKFFNSLINIKLQLILISLILFILSCDEILNPSKPDEIKWEYGAETTYSIKSGSESFTDSLTGYKFVFPAGSTGNLTAKRVPRLILK